MAIAISAFCGTLENCVVLSECKVELVEVVTEDGATTIEDGQGLTGRLCIGRTLDACLDGIDTSDLLMGADDASDVCTAILCEVKQRAQLRLIDIYGYARRVSVRADLLDGLRGHTFVTKRTMAVKFLRAAAEALLVQQPAHTHAIRVGPGGGATYRVRTGDGARAWRRDIDNDYHLHYWKSGDCVEFVCIDLHEVDMPD